MFYHIYKQHLKTRRYLNPKKHVFYSLNQQYQPPTFCEFSDFIIGKNNKHYVKFNGHNGKIRRRKLNYNKFGIPYCKTPIHRQRNILHKIDRKMINIVGKKNCDICKNFTYCCPIYIYKCNINNCLHTKIHENINYYRYLLNGKYIYKVLNNWEWDKRNVYIFSKIPDCDYHQLNVSFIEHIHTLCKECVSKNTLKNN